MDADEFLKQELNISGRISNLIHSLTYGEIKRLIEKYARLQSNSHSDLSTQRPEQSNKQD